jgi:hypothetical protein
MQSRLVKLANGRSVTFEVGDPALTPDGGQTAFFVLGIRKCGSSILNSMLNDLGRLNGFPFVDIGGGFFANNIPEQDWREDPAALNALVPNTVYGGFRAMPLVFAQSPLYQASRKILLVRDPRDALVSEYFSIAFSHGLPDETAGEGGAREEFLALREQTLASHIETVVLERAGILGETFLEYAGTLADKQARVYRYRT